MRVLITGGAGAIGSHLVEALLRRGDDVAILDSFHAFYPRSVKERNIAAARLHSNFRSLYEADIRDAHRVDEIFEEYRPEAVVHLAARAGVRPSLEDPVGYLDYNVTGTGIVLDATVRHRCERFVFASSSSVYGSRPRGPFSEGEAADRPVSPYGATKRSGELLCHATHHTTGLPVTCLRFFTVYGPRQRPDLAIHKFALLARKGDPIPVFGDGSAERDFTFVLDIVDGILRALDRCDGYRIYNLGRGRPVTLNQTIDALEHALDMEIKRVELPAQVGDVPRTWAAIDRARDELGYEPKMDLLDGLREFARWLDSDQRGSVES